MSTSTQHLELVSELAKECMRGGLTFYEHQYNYNAFGSWLIIVGKSKDRMKFTWDGKDSRLDVEVSPFQNNNSVASWENTSLLQLGPDSAPVEIFQVLQRHIRDRYGI